jgi:hypothetical protein
VFAERGAMANTKTENGIEFPSSAYAYVPDSSTPSTWKLRLWETPETKVTPKQVGMAVAALGAGFRGNKAQIPAADLPAVRSKVLGAWKSAHPGYKSEDIPAVLSKGEQSMTPQELESAVTKLEGDLTTAVAKQTDLETANVRQGKILKLNAEERAVFDGIDDVAKQDQYLDGNEDVRKQFAKAADSGDDDVNPEIAKKLDDIQKAHQEEVAKLNQRIEASEAAAKVEKAARERVEFEKRAETEYPHLPGTAVEKGASIQAVASKLTKEEADGVFKLLSAGNAALQQLGKAKGGDTSVNVNKGKDAAYSQLQAKADEIKKSNPKLTIEKAFTQAFNENPDLYEQYINEGSASA